MRFTITKIKFDVYSHSIDIEQYPNQIVVKVRKYGYGTKAQEHWYDRENPAGSTARHILNHVEFTDENPMTEQIIDGVTEIVEDMI